MPDDSKKNILFLVPGPVYKPDLPFFYNRYQALSQYFKGAVFTSVTSEKWADNNIGKFNIRGYEIKRSGILGRMDFFKFFIKEGIRLKKEEKAPDVIIAFDPMFTGFVGLILKWALGSKLIIEINNSNFVKSFQYDEGPALLKRFKIFIYKITSFLTLRFADGVSVLTEEDHWASRKKYLTGKVFSRHFYTPVEYFLDSEPEFNKEILFVGMPFYRKGVDVLIKAFQKASGKHPDFILKLMGYRLDQYAERFDLLNGKIQFVKPVFYDELKKEFLKCYCFVLPSREEGMGMVLLEAMASGKPVIGSNVGGIPGVIENGRNGFLFESEDVDGLADRLDRLLSGPDLARQMGQESRKIIEEKFTTEKYIENFRRMIETILKDNRS